MGVAATEPVTEQMKNRLGWTSPLVGAGSATPLDAYQQAARTLRESLKDKSYRAYQMGQEAGEYLRWKRGRITKDTYRDYEACLDKLARTYPDLEIGDFETPVGTQRLEEFLDGLWGDAAPRTYNKNLSIVKDFFKWAVLRGKLHGDPALPLVPHKKRDVHREIFSGDQRRAIIAEGPDDEFTFRDRCALRLFFDYGIRKGALGSVQFKHFDHNRRWLTIFTKGQKIRHLPIVDEAFWFDLERLILDIEAEPHHFLLARRKRVRFGYNRETGKPNFRWNLYPELPMAAHGLHSWWYGCLQRAGIVQEGVTRGEKMHKARHTAGQRILDKTGNIKAVQKQLGHASLSTTADIYTDWDIDQQAATMRQVLSDDD